MTAIFLGANAPQTLVKNYAIAVFAFSCYANADFANAKNAKKFLYKHEKQRKNTQKHAHAQPILEFFSIIIK